jgi:UDP-glucose 4-epimerase
VGIDQVRERYFIVGGAGFIGSHFTDKLLEDPSTAKVTLYDNFVSGREWHYQHHQKNPRLSVVRADVKESKQLQAAMAGHGVVIHLASNADIAKAVATPDIDFWEGTFLTHQVVEAMRITGAKQLLYASGSGVYGDLGTTEAHEDWGPMLPISTYGASKLSGEALISSYCSMFGIQACAFRFGNVVGPRQTHGVAFDFVRALSADPSKLRILGDGSQSKSYIHVFDVVRAVLTAHSNSEDGFQVFNVATGDYITVKEIAELTVEILQLAPRQVRFDFTGGDRGWRGDVPVVRLNTDRIRKLGWKCELSSREALRHSILAMLEDVRGGRISAQGQGSETATERDRS